ncbi:MAG: hypothetical protein NT045_09660 [Candidatus Aureabacteria bacterium]|nr:hypothetical protein [Candidatus Auribacterota bacterium]
MPIFEYCCQRCLEVTPVLERLGSWAFWRRKCRRCGSRRLKRVYSTFATKRSRSMADLMGEMRRLGPVNFVPAPPRPAGPPPGGCPYAASPDGKAREGT